MDRVHICIQYLNFVKYCKILISCTNNDQIPYFCQVYIPDITYKMHEGEIGSPHKDPLYHILHKSSVFLSDCVYHLFVGRRSRSKTL